MPKCGIFINFVFCRKLLKNEIILAKKKQTEDKTGSLCHDTTFICRDTKFKQAQGTMSQPTNLCLRKDWLELKAEKSFLGRGRKGCCHDRT